MNDKDIIWDDEIQWDEEKSQPSPQMEGQNVLGQSNEESTSKLLQALLVAGGAAAGVGIYNAGEKGRLLKTEGKGLLGELTGMQDKLGIKGTEPTFVPTKISSIISQKQRDTAFEMEKIKYDTDLAIKNHKIAIDEFDNKILNSSAENLSKTVKDNFPQLQKNVTSAYGAGMRGIENILEKNNVKFDALSFNTDVLDKTLSQAMSTGSLPNELSALTQAKEMTLPKFDSQGMMIDTPTSFTQMKGYVSSIINQDPNSKVSTMLRKNWGEFLEANAPPEVKEQLSSLNKSFKPYAEARTRLSKIMDTRTGEFDYKGLNKYFLEYAKSNIDNGTENLMRLLGEGNDIVTKISGVSDKFANLTEVKGQRTLLREMLPTMQKSQQTLLNEVASKSKVEIDKMIKWRDKSNEIISMLKQNQENLNKTRLLGIPDKIVKLGTRLAGKSLGALSIAPMIMQAVNFGKDPEGAMAEILGGKPAPQGSEEREMQMGRIA